MKINEERLGRLLEKENGKLQNLSFPHSPFVDNGGRSKHKCVACGAKPTYRCMHTPNHLLCTSCANNGFRGSCPLCTRIVGAVQLEG